MSRWTHNTCTACWNIHYPNREPVKLRRQPGESVTAETCCRCGVDTYEGIYIRWNPDELLCKGNHPGGE